MHSAIILREEIVCLIILLFLFFMAKAFKMGKDSRSFNRLTWFAIFHVAFDTITLITVNNQDVVPPWINTVCHLIFYMTAVLFANELCYYIVRLCSKNISKSIYWVGYVVLLIYVIAAELIGIRYRTVDGIVISTGPAAYIAFAVASLYLLCALTAIMLNYRNLEKMVVCTIVPILIVLLLSEVMQVLVPIFLFTGGAITIATVAFFFSLENPAHVFRQKAMIDALTGVQSRHSYDIDIEKIDRQFKKNPAVKYIFVFCDINNLKAVNGMYGHLEGDEYITLVANVFMKEFKHASNIYRMGGDEFFVIFHNVDEETVISESREVQRRCIASSPGRKYTPSVAIGYAVVGQEYKTVREAVRTADYMMYRNKAEMKGEKAFVGDVAGTRLNNTGLTDVLFDAFCSANERTYPYMSNIETGVTRIAPKWNQEFGIGNEFLADFVETWKKYIHPDDRKTFTDDIVAAMTGKQKYHNCDYRAKNAKGEYVFCSCHGAIYRGKNGEPDIFSGYLVNYGIQEKIDALTGLKNFSVLDEEMLQVLNNKEHVIVLKLGLIEYERLNMLYGYSISRDSIRAIIEIITEVAADKGEVFCNEGKNITILFRDAERGEVTDIYNVIASSLAHGINVNGAIIPFNISGGAAEVVNDNYKNKEMIRSSLLYALEESRYYKYNKLVFADLKKEGMDELGYEFLAHVHSDAANGMKNFLLRYQPVLDTQSGEVVGAEALLRWNNPAYGEVLPGKFIDFLETDSCYYNLGLDIIRQAVSDAVEIRRKLPDFRVGINITALQLRNEDFIEEISGILREYDYPPEGVLLELTERSKELDENYLKNRISELRETGFSVAFDDMGTGYSTTNLLLNIQVDEIKLDSTFVRRLMKSPGYQLFVEMLSVAASRKMIHICFEGIEDEKILELIKQYGYSYCQGFYFSKPLLIDDFKEYIGG